MKAANLKSNLYLQIGCVLFTVFIPLSFLLFNTEWLYPYVSSAHSYSNLSVSLNYSSANYQQYHYLSGFAPWLIPLHYLEKMIPLEMVIPVVQIVSWIIIGVLIFSLARILFGTRPAVLTFPWIFLIPTLIGSGVSSGVSQNLGGALYFLIALHLWVHGIKSNKSSFLKLAGISLISCFLVSITFLPLVVLFPATEIHLNGKARWSSYKFLGSGTILGIFLWGTINIFHGRSFLFFIWTIKFYYMVLTNKVEWNNALHNTFSVYNWLYLACFVLGLMKIVASKCKISAENIFAFAFTAISILWGILFFLKVPIFGWLIIYSYQFAAFLVIMSWIEDRPLTRPEWGQTLLCTCAIWLALTHSTDIRIALDYSDILMGSLLLVSVFFAFFEKTTVLWHLPYYGIMILSFGYYNFTVSPKGIVENCGYRKAFHDAFMNITKDVLKYQPNSNLILHYYHDRKIVLPDACYRHITSMRPIASCLWNISGTLLGHNGVMANDPKELDQNYFKKIPGQILVLYPFDSKSFTQDVVNRAGEFGVGLEKLGSGKQMAEDIAIPYEIYKISF